MQIDINQIPHWVLYTAGAKSAVIHSSGKDYFSDEAKPSVLVGTSPSSIIDIDPTRLVADTDAGLDLSILDERRREEGVHSITLTIARLDQDLLKAATDHLRKRFLVLSELETLARFEERAYVVYVVTHYNPGARPLGPLTVNIGGDCYRMGEQIKDLSTVLDRTKELAEAMLRKAVMIFPDIPALHGGKKGEWIVLDEAGRKIDGLSEEAIISLGSVIIPRGIRFLNRYKEKQAIEAGVFAEFPAKDYIRPDSASPDVLSGGYWRGEYPDKYINMCEAWHNRGHDMGQFTCLPANLRGTRDSSSRPTGFGVATATVELARRKFPDRPLGELRFLLEAAGGVGRSTIESLTSKYGVPSRQITVFDRSIEACSSVKDIYDVQAVSMRHDEFYNMRLPRDRKERSITYDVWINNGEGNNSRPRHIRELVDSGVRLFTGGANNFLHVATREESLGHIFDHGGWAWPDEATSGGGWTLAVKDILTRCQGKASNTDEIRERILEVITSRNSKLIEDVLKDATPETNGRVIWDNVETVIDERTRKTLSLGLGPHEMREAADTKAWQLD